MDQVRRQSVINVFLAAFEQLAAREPLIEGDVASADFAAHAEICARVEIHGSLEGFLLMGMAATTARALASHLVGRAVKIDSCALRDSLGEFVNTLAGNLTGELECDDAKLGTPTFAPGRELGESPGEVLTFGTPWGRVYLGFNLRGNSKHAEGLSADRNLELEAASVALDRTRRAFDARELVLQEQVQKLQEATEEKEQLLRELRDTQIEVLHRLALAAEYRDDATGEHTQRVGEMSALLGNLMGLPATQVEIVRTTAPLHDLGKIGIPDRILLKKGKLTAEEFDEMKGHTRIGAQILSRSRCLVLQVAQKIAGSHHECWDGGGYPEGLAGTDIPLVGRIVSLVDVFDALTHERPYKEAWPVPMAVEEIRSQRGRKFDPAIVDAFCSVYGQSS